MSTDENNWKLQQGNFTKYLYALLGAEEIWFKDDLGNICPASQSHRPVPYMNLFFFNVNFLVFFDSNLEFICQLRYDDYGKEWAFFEKDLQEARK